MKLISMIDFVLKNEDYLFNDSDGVKEGLRILINYAKFLKQPLELCMFVPCDEDGCVLKKPKEDDLNSSFFEKQLYFNESNKYQQAKERCLFEGLSLEMGCIVIKHEKGWNQILGDYEIESNNIEYLLTKKNDYILTPTAIKQIRL